MRSVESVLLTVGVLALVAAAVTTAALAAGKHHGPRPYAHHSTKKGGEGSRDRGRHGDEQGKDEQGEGGHRRVCKGHRGVCGLDVYWLRSSIQGDVFEISRRSACAPEVEQHGGAHAGPAADHRRSSS